MEDVACMWRGATWIGSFSVTYIYFCMFISISKCVVLSILRAFVFRLLVDNSLLLSFIFGIMYVVLLFKQLTTINEGKKQVYPNCSTFSPKENIFLNIRNHY